MKACGDPSCRCHIARRGGDQGWRLGANVTDDHPDARRIRNSTLQRERRKRGKS